MGKPLPVPHFHQQVEGYCLPACVQMVWKYHAITISQDAAAKRLKMRHYFGVPMSQIKLLESSKLSVTFSQGTLADIENWLVRQIPIIVFLQAGELPQWRNEVFQHAVVAVGIDEQNIVLLDPAMTSPQPLYVLLGDFMLAWSEMDYSYAAVEMKS